MRSTIQREPSPGLILGKITPPTQRNDSQKGSSDKRRPGRPPGSKNKVKEGFLEALQATKKHGPTPHPARLGAQPGGGGLGRRPSRPLWASPPAPHLASHRGSTKTVSEMLDVWWDRLIRERRRPTGDSRLDEPTDRALELRERLSQLGTIVTGDPATDARALLFSADQLQQYNQFRQQLQEVTSLKRELAAGFGSVLQAVREQTPKPTSRRRTAQRRKPSARVTPRTPRRNSRIVVRKRMPTGKRGSRTRRK